MSPCPDPLELSYWIDGCLSPDEHAAIARHVQQCAACRFDTAAPIEEAEAPAALTLVKSPAEGGPRRQRVLPKSWSHGGFHSALAAGTESAPPGDLPSVVVDAQRSVLRFRVDAATGSVIAYLVSSKPEDQAFRVILVSDREFVTDAVGSANLTSLSAADIYGAWVEVPELVAEWRLDSASEVAIGNRSVDIAGDTTANNTPTDDQALQPLPPPIRRIGEATTGSYACLPIVSGQRVILEFEQTGWVVIVANRAMLFHGRVAGGEPLLATLPTADDTAIRVLLYA